MEKIYIKENFGVSMMRKKIVILELYAYDTFRFEIILLFSIYIKLLAQPVMIKNCLRVLIITSKLSCPYNNIASVYIINMRETD